MSNRSRRLVSLAFVPALGTIALTGFWVAHQAQAAILDSQAGSVSEFTLDPTAPGFRAFTEPTPAALVLHTAVAVGGAELVGASLLTPADGSNGGTVITVPATFQRDASSPTLADAFGRLGFDAVVDEVQLAIGSDVSEVVVLDGASWTTLMRADLPLTMTLGTNLVNPETGTTLLPAGTQAFDLFDVARIASHRNPGEPSLGVALRQQTIWQAWIARTAGTAERPELFELDSGFSSIIGALASGEVSYRTIPAGTVPAEDPAATTYVGNTEAILDLFAQLIPFPEEVSPGDRPAVLLLDSTLGVSSSAEYVQLVTRSGGRVTVLGNTDGTPIPEPLVQLHDDAGLAVAESLAAALGVEVERVPLDDATTSITVVLAG